MQIPTLPPAIPKDPIRTILEDYFDLELDSFDPDALPEREDLWRLHRDLKAEYRRQAARTTWLEVGCEKNPEPRLLIRFHTEGQPAEEDETFTCSMNRSNAELLISDWNDVPVHEWRDGPGVTMYVSEVQGHQIPDDVPDEGPFCSYKEFLVDYLLIEG